MGDLIPKTRDAAVTVIDENVSPGSIRSWRDIHGHFSDEDVAFMRARLGEVDYGIIVELGPFQGRSTVALALDWLRWGNEREYWVVDDWRGGRSKDSFIRKAYDQIPEGEVRRTFDQFMEHFGLSGRVKVIQGDSAESAARFGDGTVALCFIDADHEDEAVRRDIGAWWSKIRPGGLLCGHDFVSQDRGEIGGVTGAVLNLWKQHGIGDFRAGGSCWCVRKP